LLLVPHLSIHAAGRGDPGPRRAFGDLAFICVIPDVVLPRPVRGFLLVLGLALCSAAVEGGGPIVRSSGTCRGGGDMPSGARRSARELTEMVHCVAGGRGGVGVQLR
jgi:hypothetical protein